MAWLTPRPFFCQSGFTLAWSPALCYMAAVARAKPEVHVYQWERMEGKDRAWQVEDR